MSFFGVMAARLQKELKSIESEPPFGCYVGLKDPNNITEFEATISGPDGTPYQNGYFKLEIVISDRYPMEPPSVRFLTKVYHPNIDADGRICLDTLKLPPVGAWTPSLNISTVLTTIRLLLSEPNPDDPLVPEITEEYRTNRPKFQETAKSWTKKYATESNSNLLSDVNTPETNTSTTTTSSTNPITTKKVELTLTESSKQLPQTSPKIKDKENKKNSENGTESKKSVKIEKGNDIECKRMKKGVEKKVDSKEEKKVVQIEIDSGSESERERENKKIKQQEKKSGMKGDKKEEKKDVKRKIELSESESESESERKRVKKDKKPQKADLVEKKKVSKVVDNSSESESESEREQVSKEKKKKLEIVTKKKRSKNSSDSDSDREVRIKIKTKTKAKKVDKKKEVKSVKSKPVKRREFIDDTDSEEEVQLTNKSKSISISSDSNKKKKT